MRIPTVSAAPLRAALPALVAGFGLCAPSLAQQEPAEQEHVSLRYGREAMAKQDHAGAYGHFLYGLARVAEPFPVVALLLQNADGSEKRVEYEDGRTLAWAAPVEHNAVNVSDVEVRVLEIEFKTATGA